jgi:hypothetical protein
MVQASTETTFEFTLNVQAVIKVDGKDGPDQTTTSTDRQLAENHRRRGHAAGRRRSVMIEIEQ